MGLDADTQQAAALERALRPECAPFAGAAQALIRPPEPAPPAQVGDDAYVFADRKAQRAARDAGHVNAGVPAWACRLFPWARPKAAREGAAYEHLLIADVIWGYGGGCRYEFDDCGNVGSENDQT